MPPIPVYTDSPINAAAKPTGVTPQTADVGDASKSQPVNQPATTTATAASAYAPARPGAAPSIPAPTGTAQAYSPIQPTPTQPLSHNDGPPPPQPGAVPVLNTSSGPAQTQVPPPPKAGEKVNPPVTTSAPQAASIPYPPQMSVPAPTMSYPGQQRATSTSTAPASGYTGQGNLAGIATQTLDHPPGYHQNTNASELSSHQRAANHGLIAEGTPEEEGVLGSAKKWVQATGDKIVAAEGEVWRRLSKE